MRELYGPLRHLFYLLLSLKSKVLRYNTSLQVRWHYSDRPVSPQTFSRNQPVIRNEGIVSYSRKQTEPLMWFKLKVRARMCTKAFLPLHLVSNQNYMPLCVL